VQIEDDLVMSPVGRIGVDRVEEEDRLADHFACIANLIDSQERNLPLVRCCNSKVGRLEAAISKRVVEQVLVVLVVIKSLLYFSQRECLSLGIHLGEGVVKGNNVVFGGEDSHVVHFSHRLDN
jgi:hypothetical protein